MAEIEYIDLRPSQAYHGTGMIPEGDWDIANAGFDGWDYGGTQPTKVPALFVEFKNGDESRIQWYSAGTMANFTPTPDGKGLQKAGSATSLNDQCNCFQFLTALVRAGFDDSSLIRDVTGMIGLRVKIVHEPTVERDIRGVKKKAGTLAVVDKILARPEDKKKASSSSRKTNGQESASDSLVSKKALDALIAALKAATGRSLEKKQLSAAMWASIPGNDTDRPKIMNLIIQDSFLQSLADQGVLYDVANAQVMYVGN